MSGSAHHPPSTVPIQWWRRGAAESRSSGERSPPPGGGRRNCLAFSVLAIPVVLILVLGWTQRWMSDDGFISVRVVHQIFAGNGPVFNAGERVEATTSPLWLLSLVVGRVLFFRLPVEWIAVLLGMSTTVAAVALTLLGAARVHRTWRLLPIGIVAYVVLPPAAAFATAGLETGLTLLWIVGWFLLLLRASDQPQSRAVIVAAFTLGLGPLIRPDLAVMSVLGGVTLAVLSRPTGRRSCIAIITWALVLPATYELFRMCYYGNLLPNPAYAKEATASNWTQGWEYLKDFNRPYWLWVPALVCMVAAAVTWGHVRGAMRRLVLATPAAAGLVYGFFIVRGGGDFMHARMLLPAVFALQLPVAAVPLRRSTFALLAITVLWAAVPLAAGGPPYSGIGPQGIANERAYYTNKLGNPVTLDDYASKLLVSVGRGARLRSQSGQRFVEQFSLSGSSVIQPLDPRAPAFVQRGVYAIGTIGMASVAAGTDVYIADSFGLASPIGSRLEVTNRRRPGHEKVLPSSWIFAMFGDPRAPAPWGVSTNQISDARKALGCAAIQQMLQRGREPLTLRRMALNVAESFTAFNTRIDPDPAKELQRCSR
ncbi:MAG: hypothetical protein ABSA52_18300 [Candidatus Binatia bacterium]